MLHLSGRIPFQFPGLSNMRFSSDRQKETADSSRVLAGLAKSTPGLQYMMMKDLQVVMEADHGLAEISTRRPVDSNTIFNGNSVTKTLTALAIMKLVDAGKVKLNDFVSTRIDDIPFRWDITIEQLLAHSSGLKNPIPLRWIHLQEECENFDGTHFFNSVLKENHAQSWRPGTGFRYSNLNYLILGRFIEKVTGIPYAQFIQTSILDSLDTELGFYINDLNKYAYGYQRRYTLMSFLMGFFLDEEKFIAKNEEGWLKFRPFYNNGAAYGGLIGSAKGFNIYLQALMRKDSRIITPESSLAMFAPTEASKGLMCLSWFRGELDGQRYFCHAGGGGGHYCEIRIYPELNVSSVIMLNRSGMRDERLLDSVDRSLIASY